GGVHARRGTVNWILVRWLAIGSVPAAFAGAYVISRVTGAGAEDTVKHILGWVLLVAAAGMLVKTIVQTRRSALPTGERMDTALVRPIPTMFIGIIGGFAVGLTSVGSGSLMIVMLMFLYPKLSGREMVGTDLVQAIPLVASAAIGHLIFGNLQFGLTTSVLVGAIPGVYVGARISASANDRFIRPALIAVLTISSLKLIGASNALLLGATIVSVVVIAAVFAISARRRRRQADAPLHVPLSP
ncbi:MAG: uncharacterized protein QOG50_2639, partial [Actinomycetota bacterium]|nr:uncharacterized protein [Actinomycetota bacterium]